MTIYDSETGKPIIDSATTNLDVLTIIKQQHPDLSNEELVDYYHIVMEHPEEFSQTKKYHYRDIYSEAFKKWQELLDSQKK